jgi:hypothetical protein
MEYEYDKKSPDSGLGGKIAWIEGAGSELRGAYRAGSRSAEYQAKKNLESLEAAAKSTYNIVAIWKRQQELKIALPVEYSTTSTLQSEIQHSKSMVRVGDNSIRNLSSGSDVSDRQSLKQKRIGERAIGLQNLQTLLRRKTDQKAKFGTEGLRGHLLKRYEMVHAFLLAQKKTPDLTRRTVALNVAHCFGRGEFTARNIIKWENSWIRDGAIPQAKIGGNKHHVLESLLNDEGLQLAIRQYAMSLKDGK